jgi:hypothetical protein
MVQPARRRIEEYAKAHGWRINSNADGLTLRRDLWRIDCHFTQVTHYDGTDKGERLNHAESFWGRDNATGQARVGYGQEGKIERILAWIDEPRNP